VILSVKRFTNTGHKVRGRIQWDLDALDFTPQMAFTHDPFTHTRQSPIYETYAVIEHHGSTHGGHYIMFAKQDNVWYEYDDNSISVSTPERVVSPDSYIMMLVPKARASSMSEEFRSHILAFRAREGVEKNTEA
jgi:ubiquitin C-terminal hydrolase